MKQWKTIHKKYGDFAQSAKSPFIFYTMKK